MSTTSTKFGLWLYKTFGINSILVYARIASIDTLEKIIGKVMLDVGYSNGLFKDLNFEGLFRARAHNHPQGQLRDGKLHKFLSEKEFRNPNPEKVRIGRGRCNDRGESVFYCSNELLTALVESRPEEGGYVSIASFVGINNKRYLHRISPVGYRYLRSIQSLKKMMAPLDPSKRQQFKKVDDFLDKLFHMKIKKRAYYYKLSNAVARCMLKDIKNDVGTVIHQHGLIYSSILRNHRSFNVVFRPFYANYYVIDFVQTFKVLEYNENKISLELLRQGFLKGKKTDPAQVLGIHWQDVSNQDGRFREYALT